MSDYNEWIGKQVVKKSRKPFKSGEKVGTVKGIGVNPHIDKIAFTFEEDDSYVNCQQCTLLENLNNM